MDAQTVTRQTDRLSAFMGATPKRNVIEYVFATAGLIVLLDEFRPYLVGINFEADMEVVSTNFRILIFFIYAMGLAFGLSRPRLFFTLLSNIWPALLVLSLAAASALWSSNPALTLQKALASFLLFVVSCGYVTRFGIRGTLVIFVMGLVIGVLSSVAWVFIMPQQALHRGGDIVESAHAGRWRGVFFHRVLLGQFAAVTLITMAFCIRNELRFKILRWLVAIAAIVCIVKSASAGGVITATTLTATIFATRFNAAVPQSSRLIIVLIIVLFAFPFVLIFDAVLAEWLGVLGRDFTFSGRTKLWYLLVDFIDRRPWFGYGFNAGYLALRPYFTAIFGYDFVSPHNGYLDVLIGIGFFGLTFTLFMLLRLLAGAITLATHQDFAALGPIRHLPLIVMVFLFEVNIVEAMLIENRGFATAMCALVAAVISAAQLELRQSASDHVSTIPNHSKLPGSSMIPGTLMINEPTP